MVKRICMYPRHELILNKYNLWSYLRLFSSYIRSAHFANLNITENKMMSSVVGDLSEIERNNIKIEITIRGYLKSNEILSEILKKISLMTLNNYNDKYD